MKKNLVLYLLSVIIGLASAYFIPQAIRLGIDGANRVLMVSGICTSATLATIAFYVDYKERRSKEILKSAALKDYIWSFEQLRTQARAAFYKVDTAWKDKNPSAMNGYLTQQFYSELSEKINTSFDKKENYSDLASIDETRIICCQDYLNNEEDKFVAYIKGKKAGEDINSEGFTAVLYFSRQNNDWLLYKIRYGMEIWDLLSTRNVEEK